MPALVAVEARGGEWFVEVLQRTWDAGDAVAPVDPRLPPPARARLLGVLRPARLVGPDGAVAHLDGAVPTEPGDALVVATSGSTGEPKAAVLTHAAVEASALASSARLGVDRANDRWLACLPLAHVGGLSVVTRALVTDTPLEVHDGFDADAVAGAARRGCTLVSLVGTALGRIEAAAFRWILLGGARPPDDRPANTVTTYGLTETGSGVVYDGVPLDGVEVRVAGDGEIWLRGPMLLRAYRDGRDPKHPGGWYPTGDLGGWTADGRLRVAGRRGDVVVTGGEKVWPEDVEAALRSHPGVADAAVAGRDDPEWGQRLVALVVPAAGGPPTLADLRAHVRTSLPVYCAPKEVVFVPALPRTSLGKIRRADLAPLLGDSSGAQR